MLGPLLHPSVSEIHLQVTGGRASGHGCPVSGRCHVLTLSLSNGQSPSLGGANSPLSTVASLLALHLPFPALVTPLTLPFSVPVLCVLLTLSEAGSRNTTGESAGSNSVHSRSLGKGP